MLAKPGLVRLRLGNDTDQETVITINEPTIKLAAHVGSRLTDPKTESKLPDGPQIDLPLGKFKVSQGGEQRGPEPGVRGR